MPDMLRTCLRTGCRWPAVATLAYRYATREVWLEGLPDEAGPAAYALCPHHAGTLTVPRGWQLIDRRTAAAPPREPAGRELSAVEPALEESSEAPALEEPALEEPGGGSGSGRRRDRRGAAAEANRYAALSAALPRLAAEHAAARAAGAAGPPGDPEAAGRELASQPPSSGEAGDATPPPDVPEEIEGQLAIPVARAD